MYNTGPGPQGPTAPGWDPNYQQYSSNPYMAQQPAAQPMGNVNIDLNALSAQMNATNSLTYGDSNRNFFSVQKPESWRQSDNSYHTHVRIVVKPGTGGVAHRVIHSQVGRAPDTKTIVCPKGLVAEAVRSATQCSVCEVLQFLAKNPVAGSTVVQGSVMVDGYPRIENKTLAELASVMRNKHLLLFNVIEPQFFGNPDFRPELQGHQVWWLTTKTVQNRVKELMSRYPAGYFTDPTQGRTFSISFYKERTGAAMYEVSEGPMFPVDPAVCQAAPDAQSFAPKSRNERDVKALLAAMLPGYES